MKNIFVHIRFVFCLLISFVFLFGFNNSIFAVEPDGEPSYQGIDVSGWQGYINYEAVKESGIEIVYIKATEGTDFVDPYFEINFKNAKENGLKVGVYHYLTARSNEEAEEEARFFIDNISDKSIDCKVCMDFESFENLSRAEINDIAYTFLSYVKNNYGKDVIVYSDLSDAENIFDERIANEFDLWLAYYNDYNLIDNRVLPWENWIGIQNTDEGTIPGVNGYVDRDFFTEKIFYGDEDVIEYVPKDLEESGNIISYRIRSGNTLYGLAKKFDTTIFNIARENNIKNVNLIYTGEVLKVIPNYNSVESKASTSKIYYEVKKGNTLYKISKEFNVSIEKIVSLNKIENPNLIYVGEILKIPNNL